MKEEQNLETVKSQINYQNTRQYSCYKKERSLKAIRLLVNNSKEYFLDGIEQDILALVEEGLS